MLKILNCTTCRLFYINYLLFTHSATKYPNMSEVTAKQVTDYIKKLLGKRCDEQKVVDEVLKFAKQYTKFSNEITNVIEEYLHKVINQDF